MIQETWDKKFRPAIADDLVDTSGGPVLAAMRAGLVVLRAQFGGSEDGSWMRLANVGYAAKIGLIDLRVKEEAHLRGVLLEKPE